MSESSNPNLKSIDEETGAENPIVHSDRLRLAPGNPRSIFFSLPHTHSCSRPSFQIAHLYLAQRYVLHGQQNSKKL